MHSEHIEAKGGAETSGLRRGVRGVECLRASVCATRRPPAGYQGRRRSGPRCVRWRLTVLVSWIDAGCPQQWQAAGSGNAGISAEMSGELDCDGDFDRVCDDGISDDC
jgi:hypothetical protein